MSDPSERQRLPAPFLWPLNLGELLALVHLPELLLHPLDLAAGTQVLVCVQGFAALYAIH